MITEGKTKSNRKEYRPDAPRPEVPPPVPKPLNKAIEAKEHIVFVGLSGKGKSYYMGENGVKLLKQFVEDLKKLQTYNTGFEGGDISFKTEVDINKLIKQYEFILKD